jgi:sn-glycerol 3-phosphate transport system substrate-binding protein
MMKKINLKKLFAVLSLTSVLSAAAQTPVDIVWWHSMSGALGQWVNDLAQGFNAGQKEFRVLPQYKGTYEESMEAVLTAKRSGQAPHIVQIFEVGTATMMASKGMVVSAHKVMSDAALPIDFNAFVPAVAGYYTAVNGQMMSLPFNSSTTVTWLNLDAFKAAGLPIDKLPQTWPQIRSAAEKLKANGHKCPLTTGWQGWTQLESFSTWHNIELASKGNGMFGPFPVLSANTPLHVRHIDNLSKMAKEGLFVYKGRGDAASLSFESGECAINFDSSSAYAGIAKNARFKFAVAPLPHYPDVRDAPQNTVIGGASLWVMANKAPQEYLGVARFFQYLTDARIQAQSHQRTGYLPVTKAAYELTQASGFYAKNPGMDVAVTQMIRKTTNKSRGIRLGHYQKIRVIEDEELERVWSGEKSAKEALDGINARGNDVLAKFNSSAR